MTKEAELRLARPAPLAEIGLILQAVSDICPKYRLLGVSVNDMSFPDSLLTTCNKGGLLVCRLGRAADSLQ